MLITSDYLAQQHILHENPNYGVASRQYAHLWWPYVERFEPEEILDYGAGKGRLGEELFSRGWHGEYRPYDPAIPDWCDTPEPCWGLTMCIDVLEHIEPDCLGAVLDDLERVTRARGVLTVHLQPAKKTLPDGRNAHLILKPAAWWYAKLQEHFSILEHYPIPGEDEPVGVLFVVEPK